MVTRDRNAGEHIQDLLILPVDVVCPTCGAHAIVHTVDRETRTMSGPRRLVCASCGLAREHAGTVTTIHEHGADPWFGLPLWRRVTTTWGPVWAYNAAHRDQLRSFVAAELRERTSTGGWRAKLPGWMIAGTHRAAVLKAIDSMPA